MAAPTSVRVWAESISSVTLKWVHAGSNLVKVYQSTDGVAYTAVGDFLAGSATSSTITELDGGTKYWFKLSDDNGSTFSSAVTVYTHSCLSTEASKHFNLPRFDGEQQQADNLNALAERVEAALGEPPSNIECYACPTDGAVVIDCTQGCDKVTVIVDQDINSITVHGCGEPDDDDNNPIDFFIPPSTTRQICGFPKGWGFSGDECTDSPISGGTDGRTVSANGSSKPGPPGRGTLAGSSTGGAGGSGCNCIPGAQGQLAVKCCTSNCSLDCHNKKVLVLLACGGIPPYAVSVTGSVQVKKRTGQTPASSLSYSRKEVGHNGAQIIVTPPTNSGSNVAGTAYTKNVCYYPSGASCATCNNPSFGGGNGQGYGCDDAFEDPADGSCGQPAAVTSCGDAAACAAANSGGYLYCVSTPPESCAVGCQTFADACTAVKSIGKVRDVRTAGMISNGCSPCGLNEGAVVTVTDAAGVSVSTVLAA